jgi:hypothetical protein
VVESVILVRALLYRSHNTIMNDKGSE